jgi:hypothetical protein
MESAHHAPEAEPHAGLAVRPDLLVVAISARVDAGGAARSMQALRDAASDAASALSTLAPGVAIAARRLRLGAEADKSGKPTAGDATLDAVIEVPLAPAQDFWARAALAASVVEAVAALAADLGRRRPPVRVAFRSPVGRLRDPEALRGELSSRWKAAARALAVEGAPLAQRIELPTEIREVPVSLDEVRLTLVPAR